MKVRVYIFGRNRFTANINSKITYDDYCFKLPKLETKNNISMWIILSSARCTHDLVHLRVACCYMRKYNSLLLGALYVTNIVLTFVSKLAVFIIHAEGKGLRNVALSTPLFVVLHPLYSR